MFDFLGLYAHKGLRYLVDNCTFRGRVNKIFLAVFAATCILSAPVTALESSPWGINTHTPTDVQLDTCQELGVGWIRVDFNWCNIEPVRGEFNWAVHDRIVASAADRNIHIFATLAYTPDWASDGAGIVAPPRCADDWYNFVNLAVSRYKHWVCHWGMWNEPDLSSFWSGSWSQYVELILKPGSLAAKAADPNCLVLGPELSDFNRFDTLNFFDYVMSSAGDYIDIVTQHAYGYVPEICNFLDEYFYVELSSRCDKPLWITEIGWRCDTDGEEMQATRYKSMCEEIQERDYISKVFFYSLTDGIGELGQWGIIGLDGRRKPAFDAYQNFIHNVPVEIVSGCFVATASYGAPSFEVEALSCFRDRYLLSNRAGKCLVGLYYKCSPPFSRYISKREWLKVVVRILLKPLVWCSRLVL